MCWLVWSVLLLSMLIYSFYLYVPAVVDVIIVTVVVVVVVVVFFFRWGAELFLGGHFGVLKVCVWVCVEVLCLIRDRWPSLSDTC